MARPTDKGLISKSKLTAIGDAIRGKTGGSAALTPDQMATAIAGIKADPILQAKSVTPSASDQTISADSGYDGLSQVTINGDTDLIPANIAKDVNIFGVVGEFTGSSDIVREVITLRNTYSTKYMSELVTETHVMSQITKPVFMYFTLSFSYAEYALHWYLFSTDGGVTWFNFMNGASQSMPVSYSGDNSGGKSYAKYLVLNVNGPEINFRCHQLWSSTFMPIDLTLTVVGQP